MSHNEQSLEDDANLWRQDESLRPLAELLSGDRHAVKAVSFDLFDTLLCRVCAEPSDLFIEVARRLDREGLLAYPITSLQFRAARVAADDAARKWAVRLNRPAEVCLQDIYQQLRGVVRDPARAMEIEMQVELDRCYLNLSTFSLVHWVRSRGLQVLLLSDTYFSREQILRLMNHNGLPPQLFQQILLSSECGTAKWDGGLFREAFARTGFLPGEVLHLGDNLHADVAVPRELAMPHLHYYRTTPNLDEVFQAERSQAGEVGTAAASLNSVRVLVARLAQDDRDAFRDGAFVFGPVLARYADWCVQRFRQAGVRRVLALMREGALLGELVQAAASAAGVPLEVVPCFVSRMSTARAAMSETTSDQVEEQLEGAGSLTPQAILEILGLAQEAESALPPEVLGTPLAAGEPVRGFLDRLMKSPRLRQLAEQERQTSHRLAFTYLDELTRGENRIGVIDLGWSGSIQRNVARILRLGGREIRTVGCYLATTRRAGRLFLQGDEAGSFLETPWDRTTILPEVAITACVGSTNGYQRDRSGAVLPVLGDFDIAPAEVKLKQRLREGILAFQSCWLHLRQLKGPAWLDPAFLADLDRTSGAILYRLLESPTWEEATRLGALTHDENFFGRHYSHPLCNTDSQRRLAREGVGGVIRQAGSYWPQGVLALENPRLTGQLRQPWKSPLGFGSLGARQPGRSKPSSFTDEELGELRRLLAANPQLQVLCVAPEPAGLLDALPAFSEALHGHPDKSDTTPRLILLGSQTDPTRPLSLPSFVRVLEGDPASPDVAKAARRLLQPGGSAVLILADTLPHALAGPVLATLSPFLGKTGMVLVNRGRQDLSRLAEFHGLRDPQGLNRIVCDWLMGAGGQLGYLLAEHGAATRLLEFNWIVCYRSPSRQHDPRHSWTLTLADPGDAPWLEAALSGPLHAPALPNHAAPSPIPPACTAAPA